MASPGGGALLPQISLDRGAGEVDPGAAAWRHQFGGEQEPQRVGHPADTPSSFAPSNALYRNTQLQF